MDHAAHATRAALGARPAPALPPIGSLPGNERSYRRPPDQHAGRYRGFPAPARRPGPGPDDEEPGYVIHLAVRVPSVDAATRLARTVADALVFMPELDAGETTVSTADDQNNRRRVFCDVLLSGRSRCPQAYGHRGPCG